MAEMDPKMKPDLDAVRADIKVLMDRNGWSQAFVARQSGQASATVSAFMAGNYAGNNEAVADRLQKLCATMASRDALGAHLVAPPAFVGTSNAVRVTKRLTYAQSTGDLVVIIGDPGSGKTMAGEDYARRGSCVWTVTMKIDARTVVPALQELAAAIGVEDTGGAASIRRRLVARLRGTGGLLIIDEAQVLKPDALEALRGIWDAAKIGMALMGDGTLEEVIARLPQFDSRTGSKARLLPPTLADVTAIAGHYGVTGKDAYAFLHTLSQRKGGLRYVHKVVRLAAVEAIGAGGAITPEHLAMAWDELHLGDRS